MEREHFPSVLLIGKSRVQGSKYHMCLILIKIFKHARNEKPGRIHTEVGPVMISGSYYKDVFPHRDFS